MSTDYTCFSCTQVTEHSTTTIIRLLIIVFSFSCLLIRLKGQGESMSCYNRFFQYFVCNRLIAVHFSLISEIVISPLISALRFRFCILHTWLPWTTTTPCLYVYKKKYIKCYHMYLCVCMMLPLDARRDGRELREKTLVRRVIDRRDPCLRYI